MVSPVPPGPPGPWSAQGQGQPLWSHWAGRGESPGCSQAHNYHPNREILISNSPSMEMENLNEGATRLMYAGAGPDAESWSSK